MESSFVGQMKIRCVMFHPLLGHWTQSANSSYRTTKLIFTAMLDVCFCEAIKSRFFRFKALILIDYLGRVLANKKKIGVVPWFSKLDV